MPDNVMHLFVIYYFMAMIVAGNGVTMCASRLLSMRWDQISVECYSGQKANDRPVVFTLHKQRWKVAEIIDRWYEGGVEAGQPEVNYFKVRTTEGNIFLLRYILLLDSWSIQAYEDPAAIIGVC